MCGIAIVIAGNVTISVWAQCRQRRPRSSLILINRVVPPKGATHGFRAHLSGRAKAAQRPDTVFAQAGLWRLLDRCLAGGSIKAAVEALDLPFALPRRFQWNEQPRFPGVIPPPRFERRTSNAEHRTSNGPAGYAFEASRFVAVWMLFMKMRINSSVSWINSRTESSCWSRGTRWISRNQRKDSRNSLRHIFSL